MARKGVRSGTRPSIHNVAAYAGVSIATVSKVMHGDATVRPENVKSVQNAIEALGYRINPLAAELRRGRRRLVGLILPNFDDPFHVQLLAALEQQAEAQGYGLATASSRDGEPRELELLARMEDWRVAGVVIVPVKARRRAASLLLSELDLKAVFVDRIGGNSAFDSVSPDYGAAIEQVAVDMAELGHDIVLVPEKESSRSAASHGQLFAEALKRHRPAARVELLPWVGAHDRLVQRMHAVLGRRQRPSAVVSFDALAIVVALNEVRSRGWRLPAELTLFSFEEARWMAVHEPPIGVLRYPADRIAALAMEQLLRRINRDDGPALTRLEACHVEYRRSVGPRPARLPTPRATSR